MNTSVLLCIYMHREFGAICKLDPVVELIWSKACITKASTKAITTSIVKTIASCLTRSKSGSYRGVDLVESSVTQAITKTIATSIVKAIASCLTRSKSGNGQV